jgi:hypothetical protein
MTRLSRSAVVRFVASVLLLGQAACLTAPQPVQQPAEFFKANTPSTIYVTLQDGSRLVVDNPRLFGDSLLGYKRGAELASEIWVGLSSLQEVRVRKVSVTRTSLFAVAGVAGVAVVASLFAGVGASDRERGCPLPNPDDCEAFRIPLGVRIR